MTKKAPKKSFKKKKTFKQSFKCSYIDRTTILKYRSLKL